LVSLAVAGFAILGIQLVYLILFLIAFSKRESRLQQEPHPVSIIVCAHDEEQNLRELVPLLLQQNHPEFELIIVEDRCNDGTYDYLLQATKEFANLKMVRVVNKPEHVNGKKFALTLGIKAAKYELVLLTDADCRPASNQWATFMTSKYQPHTKFVLGFSPYQKSESWLNAFIRFESTLTGIQFIGMALLGKPYMGVGRNLLYKKRVFLDNKGFNLHLDVVGGDDDLFVNQHATKSNTMVQIGAEALMVSKPKTTWKEFYYQKLRHLSVGKRYKFSDKFILGLFSLTWILIWLFAVPFSFFGSWMYFFWGVFFLRWILLIALVHRASRKLGQPFEAWKAPILDFIYAFYYLVAGVAAVTAKHIRWKS
jgi:glycosyltransferase involved in cell wall biosynthesis